MRNEYQRFTFAPAPFQRVRRTWNAIPALAYIAVAVAIMAVW